MDIYFTISLKQVSQGRCSQGTAAGSVLTEYTFLPLQNRWPGLKKKISPLPFPPTPTVLDETFPNNSESIPPLASFPYLPLPNLTLVLFPRQLIVPLTQPLVPVITDGREWSYIARQLSPEPWRTHKLTSIVAGLVTCVMTSQNRASAS